MNIKNSNDTSIYLRRGSLTVKIVPGVSSIPDYNWLDIAVGKQSGVEVVSKISFTPIGTIEESCKAINTTKAASVPKPSAKKKTKRPAKKKANNNV